MYLCLRCGARLTYIQQRDRPADSKRKEPYSICPMAGCYNVNVVEVDENILEVIRILNGKGYTTKYCCGGHDYDRMIKTYIMFEQPLTGVEIPEGFIYQEDDNVIRCTNHLERFTDIVALRKEINRVNTILLDWVVNLPDKSK